ncbi:response regulator [Actomonas aquatica]|uniref:Response regulator transcription factor n=1 Tax=Actomonas aquatica TaxID=2866162 RepID=A0ABZ1C4Y4_9BACT|nr:response regulator transcription factor [Opitutus sp. WL0086]WRQ86789.1 response regulator transcription factor [Opitutus sp. WL0086]
MTAQDTIRVLIVDDSTLVREGIRSVLHDHGAESGIQVCGEAATVAEAISSAIEHRPDVVLLDIRLPDGSGFTACREILKNLPDTRILVLTSFTSDGFVYEAITSGAQGYLMKEIDPLGLVKAISDIMEGKSILSPDITAGVMRMMRGGKGEAGDLSILSPQERRVLALVAEGKTNKQIGDEMGLSDNTVKNYLCSVFDKLQVRRRSQAAALYVQSQSQHS